MSKCCSNYDVNADDVINYLWTSLFNPQQSILLPYFVEIVCDVNKCCQQMLSTNVVGKFLMIEIVNK